MDPASSGHDLRSLQHIRKRTDGDDGEPRIPLPQRVDDAEAIHSRQQDIRNHEVRGLGCRRRERGFTVRDGSDRIPLGPQRAHDEVARLGMVVNDQDHGRHEAGSG